MWKLFLSDILVSKAECKSHPGSRPTLQEIIVKRLALSLTRSVQAVHCTFSTPQHFVRFLQQISVSSLHPLVERGTVRVKCLAQEHNAVTTSPGLILNHLIRSTTL